jgi:spermidine synthase
MAPQDEASPPTRGDLAGALLVAALLACSGAAALAYEVTWNRWLGAWMGNTAHAVAVILTVFMGGLAVGTALGGQLARRAGDPLRLYARLEIAVGACCLLVPWGAPMLRPVVAASYVHFEGSPTLLSVGHLLVAGLVLLPPTALMGSTLPVLAACLTSRGRGISTSVGLAYGANTVGAVAGALLAGYFLIPSVGLLRTHLAAVAVNFVAGTVALIGAWRARVPPATEPVREPERRAPDHGAGEAGARTIPSGLVLGGLVASGFAAMALEVAWTRVATLSIGSAPHAFSLVVAAFILGIALGAPIFGRLGDVRGAAAPLLATCALGAAATAAVASPVLGELPIRVAVTIARHSRSFERLQLAELTVIAGAILAPTFLMGGMVPLAARLLTQGVPGRVGPALGRAYAASAAGNILGALVAGFALVPALGMERTIALGVLVNAAVGAGFLVAWPTRAPALRWAAAAAMAILGLVHAVRVAPWDRRVLTSAPFLEPPVLAVGGEAAEAVVRILVASREEPVFYREDAVATVSVTEAGGRRTMRIGGTPQAVDTDPAQALVAHLPLLLHATSRDVLVIGLGSGESVAAALRHPTVETVDCVEISPAVVEAARRFFQQDARPLEDPRVRLVLGDGRAHLAHAPRRYDVVVSQPGNPWMASSWTLFTREAFLDMRGRLRPGGIAAVWLQGWMSPEAVRTLLATFLSAFAHVDVWEAVTPGQYVVTGYLEAALLDAEAMEERFRDPAVATHLRSFGIDSAADLLSHFITDDEGARTLAGSWPASTDDMDRIGSRSARDLWSNRAIDVRDALEEVRSPLAARLARRSPPLDPRGAPAP